jgi:hypothetical protein
VHRDRFSDKRTFPARSAPNRKCPRDGFVQPKRQIFRALFPEKAMAARVFSDTRPRSSKLFGPASSGVLRVLRIIQVCPSGFYLCPTALSQPSIGDTRFKSTTVGVVSLRAGVRRLAGLGAPAEFNRRQTATRRHHKTRQSLPAPATHQWGKRQSAAIEGDQSRSMGDPADRLGGDAARERIPAPDSGGLIRRGRRWSLRESNDA